MGCFVAWRSAGVEDVAVGTTGIEEVGGEAGGFVLEDDVAVQVGWGFGDVGAGGKGDEIGDVGVEGEDFVDGGCEADFG
jgi:hypothetical protein